MDTQAQIHALKEWAVAVEALRRGETIMLLRKGGIREEGRHFRVAHDEVLLYPTFEHQQPHLLKPQYAAQVQPVESGWHPHTVPISAWARVTDIFRVSEKPTLAALLPQHIWNEQFAAERFGWKPRHPLWVLLLRAYALPRAIEIPYDAAYGGCTSWIDLRQPIDIRAATPALSDDAYDRRVAAIRSIVEQEQLAGVGIDPRG